MHRSLTLFHISDLHFGAEDRDALAWFVQEVNRQQPDAVICTGDVTMRGISREFAAAEQWFSRLCVPASIEPGNHDIPYYWEMRERLRRPFARFETFRAAVHRTLDLPGLEVIPLPTIVPAQWRLNWSKGRVTDGALRGALSRLAQHSRPSLRLPSLRLVACHHPLVDAGTPGKGATRGGRAALMALAGAGVDAVLSGHVHDPFDRHMTIEGRTIRLIGAGTLSQRLRTSPPGYNRLEWSEDAMLRVTAITKPA